MKQQTIYLKTTLCLLFLLSLGLTSVAHAHPLKPQDGSPAFPNAQDIGYVGHAGATIVSGDAYRIWGSGNDIWGHSDQFQYAWTSLSGDGEVIAQVLSQEDTDDWAKAGIMLRDSLDSHAANVFLALTPAHGVTFQWRSASHEQTWYQSGPPAQAPSWLKLVRHDQTITGFASADGTTWTQVYSVTTHLDDPSLIGLAVTAHNNDTRSRAVFTNVQLTLGTPPPGPPALTATQVYGQAGDFTTEADNKGGLSANSLSEPGEVALDGSGGLYVADYNNHRVLYYPAGSTTATRVYGQPDFSTSTSGTTATSLNEPWGIALDAWGDLYVADYGNNRVLYYAAGSTTATRVYGQTNFTSSTSGTTATTLNEPAGVAVDSNGDLYVVDEGNHRVLYYAAGSTTATRVYGQANFTTGTANTGGLSATSLDDPWAVALDSSGNLYVADAGNHRVLYYPADSTTATRVYGQADSFTTGTANNGGISATSLDSPEAIALDSSGNLFVGDTGNHRVLYYPADSTTATRVYGQPDFATGTVNTGGLSATSLDDPNGIALDASGNLYVSDDSDTRVLMFPHT